MLQQDIEGGHYNTDDVDTEDCDFDEDEACLLLDYTLTAIVNGSYQLSLKNKLYCQSAPNKKRKSHSISFVFVRKGN